MWIKIKKRSVFLSWVGKSIVQSRTLVPSFQTESHKNEVKHHIMVPKKNHKNANGRQHLPPFTCKQLPMDFHFAFLVSAVTAKTLSHISLCSILHIHIWDIFYMYRKWTKIIISYASYYYRIMLIQESALHIQMLFFIAMLMFFTFIRIKCQLSLLPNLNIHRS